MTTFEIIATIALVAIFVLLCLIFSKLKTIKMTNEEILAALEEADQATNDIAADIQILIDSKVVSQEVADKLAAHVGKLKGIAAER